RLPRVDAEPHRDFDRLVELGAAARVDQDRERLFHRVALVAVDLRGRVSISLARLRHMLPYTTSMPRLRAVPSTVRIAVWRVAAVRSGIFMRAISSTCLRVTWPTFFLLGSPEPLSTPAAFFSSTDAGGVFSTKVKERSA